MINVFQAFWGPILIVDSAKGNKSSRNYLIYMTKYWSHDRDEVGVSGEMLKQVEQTFQLLQGNRDSCTTHKSYNGRMRQKLGDEPQSIQSNRGWGMELGNVE